MKKLSNPIIILYSTLGIIFNISAMHQEDAETTALELRKNMTTPTPTLNQANKQETLADKLRKNNPETSSANKIDTSNFKASDLISLFFSGIQNEIKMAKTLTSREFKKQHQEIKHEISVRFHFVLNIAKENNCNQALLSLIEQSFGNHTPQNKTAMAKANNDKLENGTFLSETVHELIQSEKVKLLVADFE